jgi:hypothetical protein
MTSNRYIPQQPNRHRHRTIIALTLTDHCSAATLTLTAEALENTAFGQTSRTFTAGLFSNEFTLTLFQSYGATEVETMLNTLFGVESTLVISPAESGAESASNPILHSGWLLFRNRHTNRFNRWRALRR